MDTIRKEPGWWPRFLHYHMSVSFLSKDMSAFMVEPLTARGVAVVVVAYDIAPKGNEDGPRGWKAAGLWRGGSHPPWTLTPLLLCVQEPWTR